MKIRRVAGMFIAPYFLCVALDAHNFLFNGNAINTRIKFDIGKRKLYHHIVCQWIGPAAGGRFFPAYFCYYLFSYNVVVAASTPPTPHVHAQRKIVHIFFLVRENSHGDASGVIITVNFIIPYERRSFGIRMFRFSFYVCGHTEAFSIEEETNSFGDMSTTWNRRVYILGGVVRVVRATERKCTKKWDVKKM